MGKTDLVKGGESVDEWDTGLIILCVVEYLIVAFLIYLAFIL